MTDKVRPTIPAEVTCACGHTARVHSDNITSMGPIGCLAGGGYAQGPECPCSTRESKVSPADDHYGWLAAHLTACDACNAAAGEPCREWCIGGLS